MLENMDRAQIIRLAAWYFLVAGIFSLCGGLILFGVGGLAGIGGIIGAGTAGLDESGELAAASAGLAGVGFLAAIFGIISIITAPVMIVTAVGLFQKKPWARMGVVIAGALNVIASIYFLFTGSGISQLIWIAVSGFIVYFFYTDPGIKQELGG
jgi:hypothetical protein